jgi:hypothetical protein
MSAFRVDLPAGGSLELNDVDECQLWNESGRRFVDDYGITKTNDLVLLGALLTQTIHMYRAQRDMNDPKKASSAQNAIIKAATEIRDLEKALGIDKKTREQGGQHTVGDYVKTLKLAAHERGAHISKRTLAYEAFCMDLRWRVRLLRNGDAEDRQYHGVSEKSIVLFVETELAKLEEIDKKFAREKGKVFVGRL